MSRDKFDETRRALRQGTSGPCRCSRFLGSLGSRETGVFLQIVSLSDSPETRARAPPGNLIFSHINEPRVWLTGSVSDFHLRSATVVENQILHGIKRFRLSLDVETFPRSKLYEAKLCRAAAQNEMERLERLTIGKVLAKKQSWQYFQICATRQTRHATQVRNPPACSVETRNTLLQVHARHRGAVHRRRQRPSSSRNQADRSYRGCVPGLVSTGV
jgi:hypothetical protein